MSPSEVFDTNKGQNLRIDEARPVRDTIAASMPCHGKKVFINIYVCCAIGGFIGFMFTVVLGKKDTTSRIEYVAVGMFGGACGGEWLAPLFGADATENTSPFKMLWAAIGAGVLMFLLSIMQKVVGPMYVAKSKNRGG